MSYVSTASPAAWGGREFRLRRSQVMCLLELGRMSVSDCAFLCTIDTSEQRRLCMYMQQCNNSDDDQRRCFSFIFDCQPARCALGLEADGNVPKDELALGPCLSSLQPPKHYLTPPASSFLVFSTPFVILCVTISEANLPRLSNALSCHNRHPRLPTEP